MNGVFASTMKKVARVSSQQTIRKEKYTDASLSYFNMGAIHFVYNMICANAYEDANERLNKVKMEFKKQLLQFQKECIVAGEFLGSAKVVYSEQAQSGYEGRSRDDATVYVLLGPTIFEKEIMPLRGFI